MPMINFSALSWQEQVTFDDDIQFVLDQHTELNLHRLISLKQQSAGRDVVPLYTLF